MAIKELENYYEFEIELADGTTETLKIPRLKTRDKYKLLIAIQKIHKSKEDSGSETEGNTDANDQDIAELLIDRLCPGLMDRAGDKSPTMLSLGLLTDKIITMDGDSIFGKGWQKKLKKTLKKEVKKPKKRRKKSTK